MPSIDVIGEALWSASAPLSFIVALFVSFLIPGALPRKFLGALSVGIGMFAFFFLSSLGIVMRDGMGPDAITSDGLLAFQLSAPGILIAALFGMVLSAPGILMIFVVSADDKGERNKGESRRLG